MSQYYISGPMRGKPDYNRDLFRDVERELKLWLGFTHAVVNPRENFGGDSSRRPSEYLTLALKQVIESDVIVLLPDWRESEGARREVELAIWADKRFMEAKQDIGFNDIPYWCFEDIDISAPSVDPSPRADLLDEAKALITGDRNNTYGPPSQDFTRTAGALNAYGYRGPEGRELASHDVAIFIMSVKLSRLMWSPAKRDGWVDIAGYAACGYQCSLEE